MARPIGYYVHHHGDGHRQRALAIAHAAEGRVTLLGTGLAGRTEGLPCIDLPDDRMASGGFDGRDGATRPAALHYAPLDHAGLRGRVATISRWIEEAAPALLVVDVSVEVAMLARLASVPTVYVRLGGLRLDEPHRQAFEGAVALLAPFASLLDDPHVPQTIRARTFYAPGIVATAAPTGCRTDGVLVVVGRGGTCADGEYWAAAARATPDICWRVIGPCSVPLAPPANLELLGWVDGAGAFIASAEIVVGGAGDGLVNAVIAARKPFICLPEPRPFDEQTAKAARLDKVGAAIVSFKSPTAAHWPGLIRRARMLDPDCLTALDGENGAVHTANWLAGLADGDVARRYSA